MSEIMDPAKMKVVELRAELANRGLDQRGNKATLVDRLKEALEKETGQVIQDSSILDTSTETDAHDESFQHKNKKMKVEPDENSQNIKVEKNISPSKNDTTSSQVEIKQEKDVVKSENVVEPKSEPLDQGKTADIKQETKQETVSVKQENEERRGEKRPHSPPRYQHGAQPKVEDEPELDEKSVTLGWYDSDLNLIIDKSDFTKAAPLFQQGFGYVWAGARATHGFVQGKVFFEVKVTEYCDVSHLEDEPNPHVLRVGWSVQNTSTQLGEEPLSYGYGGTGKTSTDCKFKDYGVPFNEGDVVGSFLDLDGNQVTISYTVNGTPHGVAFRISHSDLQNRALFPHILTKNAKFECNFGAMDPWFPPLNGYTFVGLVPLNKRIPGPQRPEKKSDCEMIMMCGLPACGKTTWANKYSAENPEKMYNILGTNNLIDKMKVMGLPRKRNYAGRWDVLIEKCTKCLVKLLEMAGRRRRNYILDQTNVYPKAQRRKMQAFVGFRRVAVVIVPTEEEFKDRAAKQEKVEGKDVPDSAVLEMKANFTLPQLNDPFDEVRFVELPEAEARELVEKYNKEGKDAGYGQQRIGRPGGGNRDSRPFRGGSGGFRGRGGGDNRNRGSWQPRGGGGWKDRNQGGGYRGNNTNDSSNKGSGWQGGRGGRYDSQGGRSYDRDRNRSGGGYGSGGRNQQGGKGNWGNYNQGGGYGTSTGGNSWGQQNYNQQGYGQQGGSYNQGYGQSYGGSGGGAGGNYGGSWNQQQQGYGGGGGGGYNQGYGGGGQGWGNQSGGNNYGYQQQQQQGGWQGGYGQGGGYYGGGMAPK